MNVSNKVILIVIILIVVSRPFFASYALTTGVCIHLPSPISTITFFGGYFVFTCTKNLLNNTTKVKLTSLSFYCHG